MDIQTSLSAVYWVLGLFGTLILSMMTTMFVWSSRIAKLAESVATIATSTEIYERSQERIFAEHARLQESLLKTIQSIVEQHADMYRELSSRFSTLEERSTNHGEQLRRNARNVHDLREETRKALSNSFDDLREEFGEFQKTHREDIARIHGQMGSDR